MTLATVLVAAATGAATGASPAAAAGSNAWADQVSLVYTDSLDVHGNTSDWYNLPVGAWRDDSGKHHMSRVYATYDVAAFAGKRLIGATLYTHETRATDCVDRQIQVWTTAPAANPTWADPPAEQALVGTIGSGTACPAYLHLDLTSTVAGALAAGRSRIALELRVPADLEGDVDFGRTLAQPILSVNYNSLPSVPTGLSVNGRACTSQPYPYVGRTPYLQARFADADSSDRLNGTLAVWPVDHPDQRREFDLSYLSSGWWRGVQIPDGVLAEDTAYAWQARLSDGTDVSDWSATCRFTTDGVRPGTPAVGSPDYPEDGWLTGGTPGRFTFSANGSADVAYFQYAWNHQPGVPCLIEFGPYSEATASGPEGKPDMIAADTLGGSATVEQSPPAAGPNTLYVRSVDRACNVSQETVAFEFFVSDTEPLVTADGQPELGQPLHLTFTPGPGVTGVLDYTYRVNYGDPQTVQAGPDGSATVTVTPEHTGQFTVDVSSRSDNGWVSPQGHWSAFLSSAPKISSDVYPDYFATGEAGGGVGVTGNFTFSSTLPGVAGFMYFVDWGDSVTVPADADGSATIAWTPDAGGYHEIDVWAVDENGSTLSDLGTYAVYVQDTGSAEL